MLNVPAEVPAAMQEEQWFDLLKQCLGELVPRGSLSDASGIPACAREILEKSPPFAPPNEPE